MKKLIVLLTAAISINSFACESAGEKIDKIKGVQYEVVKINEDNLILSKKPFIVFDKNENGYFAYGSSGCNNFRGQIIENENTSMKLTKVMGTKKLCEPSRNEIENVFLSTFSDRDFFLLKDNDYFVLESNGDKIYLKNNKK
jgi:heat shock protein HslJ